MDDRAVTRISAAAGLAVVLVVGASVLGAPAIGAPAVSWAWWLAYGLYLAAFAVDLRMDARAPADRPRWAAPRTLVAVQALTGAAAWLLSSSLPWTSVLFVVTAASAAFVLASRQVYVLVAAQSALVAVGTATSGATVAITVFSTVIYASFQVFAVLLVTIAQREAAARADLTVAHAQLRAATALLEASARDGERLRIARELHDALGHQLTALALELEVATHHARPPADEHVRRARDIAKTLLEEVRGAVGELRAPTHGLRDALEGVTTGLPSLQVHLHVFESVPLEGQKAAMVVRCVQEIATNALRHARATQLWVRVTCDGDGLALEAHDDGLGAALVRPGNGLTGMRERIEALGGHLRLEAGQGRGFRVIAKVPAP